MSKNGNRTIKIFLDDVRLPPKGDWVVFRSAPELARFIAGALRMDLERVEIISLDHDLGERRTGYWLMSWIERATAMGLLKSACGVAYLTHSANPTGRDNIFASIKALRRRCGSEGAKRSLPRWRS